GDLAAGGHAETSASASCRVNAPAYNAFPTIAPSTPTGTREAMACRSASEDTPPLATTGRSVAAHTPRSRSRLGPVMVPSRPRPGARRRTSRCRRRPARGARHGPWRRRRRAAVPGGRWSCWSRSGPPVEGEGDEDGQRGEPEDRGRGTHPGIRPDQPDDRLDG